MSDFCSEFCPFLGCASCAYSGGEIPAAATESPPVSGVECETIEAAPGGASTPLLQGPTTQTSEESEWL